MMKVNPIEIIRKYYDQHSQAYEVLVVHSEMVKQKSLEFAEKVSHLNPDLQFVEEAAMLHDIAIFLTHAPEIDCHGESPYISHGPLGRELLEKEGLPRHALVCDRHTGVGISKKDVIEQKLPLPERDMLPVSIEEKIICFADTFYRKNPDKLRQPKTIEMVEKKMATYGQNHLERVKSFRLLFSV